LLAIRQGGDRLYPRAQFTEHQVIPGLPEVIRGLAVSGPWVTRECLTTEDSVPDGFAPREALLQRREMRLRVMMLVCGYAGGDARLRLCGW